MEIASTVCSISRPAILLWCIILLTSTTTIRGNETDRLALLAIKSQIRDPQGVMSSWNNSVAWCQWKSVKCGRRHQRITELNLSFQSLGGSLSPHVGNLSFLRFINLESNSFNGKIPPEIGRLFRLEIMLLSNNSFEGTIPTNLSHCSNLRVFYAFDNNLTGTIPAELGYLLTLENLSIRVNHLTGQLPASLGNLSALKEFNVRGNGLQGKIPESLGNLRTLVRLNLGQNQFSDMVPPTLYNISSLEHFFLYTNRLHGSLPFNKGFTLPNVKEFSIGENNFSGPLPDSLSNATKLELLETSRNHFSGKVPINFNGLKNLSRLQLGQNYLGFGADDDLEFLISLTNCTRLIVLGLEMNQFGGAMPNSIANLSTTLTILAIGENQIFGTIPSGIANLVDLNVIGMESNQLTGTIPDAIGKLKNLQSLLLNGNSLSGEIPASVGNLSLLITLALDSNNLQGSIPPALGKCQQMTTLNLAQNRLTGTLPRQICSITTLSIILDLSDNFLTGSFPSEVGNLDNLVALDISRNRFSGEIPAALGGCTSLEILYLGNNSFYGRIPPSLSSLRSIKSLDLSRNNLSGQIPEFFENLTFLKLLNLSYNHFEGEVPTEGVFSNATAISLTGNEELCGGLANLHLPPCRFKESKKPAIPLRLKLILIACAIVGFILLSSSILFCWYGRTKTKTKTEPSSAPSWSNSILKVSYQELLKATDGFSSANMIGEGSFGRVYKGILNQSRDKFFIAVKVFKLQHRGASKSFMAECESLRNIKHRNLVKIISACSSIDFQGNAFKALIYEFMPNGSLEMWLHTFPKANGDSGEPRGGLNFLQRLNIAIDVACALNYLHQHCQVTIVHCDLKPSNVLLDNDMVAHVGDFGLARFFSEANNKVSANQTSSVGLAGTIGYAAPEYGMGSEASTYGDVFSYGILLLELFTSKRPTGEMFKDGLTLHGFTKMALPKRVLQIVDPLLLYGDTAEVDDSTSSRNSRRSYTGEEKMRECLISVLSIGVACSVESPKDRMDMGDVARELHLIRDRFLESELLSMEFGNSSAKG